MEHCEIKSVYQIDPCQFRQSLYLLVHSRKMKSYTEVAALVDYLKKYFSIKIFAESNVKETSCQLDVKKDTDSKQCAWQFVIGSQIKAG